MDTYKFKSKEEMWDYLKTNYEYECYLDNIKIKSVKNKTSDYLLIPEIVTEIGDEAFEQCNNIKQLYIPDSVKKIGNNAFGFCYNLIELYIGKNATFTSKSFIMTLFGHDVSIFYRIVNMSKIDHIDDFYLKDICVLYDDFNNIDHDLKTSDEGYSFYLHDGRCNVFDVPKELIKDGLLYMDKITYKNEELKNIYLYKCPNLHRNCSACIISADVKKLNNTFRDSAIEYVSLPDSINEMDKAFFDCRILKYVRMPKKMDKISAYCFEGCYNLGTITTPDGLETIESSSLSYCIGCPVKIPRSVKTIEKDAFWNSGGKLEIIYEGTKEEWKKIDKKDFWQGGEWFSKSKKYAPYHVKCLDGSIYQKGWHRDVQNRTN